MVGIISSSGLGLFDSSLDRLGQSIGQSNFGQGHGQDYVNIATGNLSVQFLDESLSGTGADLFAMRTYNSQGGYVDGDADGWRWSGEKKLVLMSGSVNQANSVLLRTLSDGTYVTYSWYGSAYVSSAGSGAHDKVTYDSATNEWVYSADSSGDAVERYDGSTGWIKTYRDNSGNGFDYTFSGNRLTSVRDIQSGQTLEFIYGANAYNQLSQINTRTTATGVLTKQVYYTYTAGGRLNSVSTDLTPSDNSIADNNVYTTNYSYDANGLLSGISQSDGTSVSFKHTLVNGSYRVTEVTDQTGTTTFSYDISSRTTIVKNGNGDNWAYVYDALGQLVSFTSTFVGGQGQKASYSYDAEGNVKTITDGVGKVITYTYDANGNRKTEVDSLGNSITRTFDSNNRLSTETRYTIPSLTAPSGAETTRYIYDAAGRLRFVVSAEGHVNETRYTSQGQVLYTLQYTSATYDVSALPASTTLTEAQLLNWVFALTPQQRGAFQLSEFAYDYRGNLSRKVDYATVTTSGSGSLDNAANITEYTYSESGQLLQTFVDRGPGFATKYLQSSAAYDGLGRQISLTNETGTTTTSYNGTQITVTNSATGLTVVSTTDNRGRLTSLSSTGDGINRVTKYYYDNAGQLRMTEDPTGARSYLFYDVAGRVSAKVNAAGAATVYTFDANGRVLTETQYANTTNTSGWFNGTVVTEGGLSIGTANTNIIQDPANDRLTTYTYDDTGRLKTTTVDGLATVTNTYDGESRLTQIQQGDRITRYFYDKDGRQIGVLNAENYLSENRYDAAGRLIKSIRYGKLVASISDFATMRASVWTDSSLVTYFYYDAEGRQVGTVDEQGFLTETVYDSVNNRRQTIRYFNPVSATEFNVVGDLRASAGAYEITTTNFDGYGRVDNVVGVDGTFYLSRNIYDAAGRLVRQIQAEGTADQRATRTRYNAFGEVIGTVSGVGEASSSDITTAINNYGTRYDIDGAGRKIAEYGPNGQKTFLFYNAAGQLTYTVNALGEVAQSTYNTFGQVTKVRVFSNRIDTSGLTGGAITSTLTTRVTAISDNAIDKVESTDYNRIGLVEMTRDGEGSPAIYNYNSYGDLVKIRNYISESLNISTLTQYGRDRLGRQTYVQKDADTGGISALTQTIYDGFGRVKNTIDANGRTSSILYSDNGRTVTSIDPLGYSKQIETDALGRTLKVFDGFGNLTYYTYDDVNRTVVVTQPDGTQIKTWKTRTGETLQVQDALGNITKYTYTKDGMLDTVTDALGVVTTDNDYDNSGRVYQTKDGNGVITRYSYDTANRLVTKTIDPSGLNIQTSYQFDGQGRKIYVTEGANTVSASTTQYIYDRKGQITQTIIDPSGLQLSTRFTYDGIGETIKVEKGTLSNPSQQTTTYTYDKVGRKTIEQVDPNGLNITTQYRYDANGNLTRKIDASGNSTWFIYRSDNKLGLTVNALGEATWFDYDNNGKLIQTTKFANTISTAGWGDNAYGTYTKPVASLNDQRNFSVYDNNGREKYTLTSLDGNNWSVVENTYDANNNLIQKREYATAIASGVVNAISANNSASGAVIRDYELAPSIVANSIADRITRYAYDAAGRLRFTVDATSAVSETQYDAIGNVVKKIDYATKLSANDISSLTTLNTLGVNQAANGTFSNATNGMPANWSFGSYLASAKVGINYSPDWSLSTSDASENTVYIEQASAGVAGGYQELGQVASVQSGKKYSFSVYAGAHRARAAAIIVWYDANNNSLGYTSEDASNSMVSYEQTGGPSLSGYKRLVAQGVAPQGAVRAALLIRKYNTDASYTGSYLFAARAQFEEIGANASQATAWVKNILKTDESNDRITTYTYDAAGRQTKTTLAGWYDQTDGKVYASSEGQSDRFQRTTEVTYDAFGNAVANKIRTGVSTYVYQYKTYDAVGREVYDIDSLGYVTQKTYDAFGNQKTLTRFGNKDSVIGTAASYWTTNDIATKLDGKTGRTVKTDYDALGRTIRVTQPSTGNNNYVSVLSAQTNVANPSLYSGQMVTEFFYDAFGNRIKQSSTVNNAGSRAEVYSYYDRLGRQTFAVDALGYGTQTDYNTFGETIRTTEFANPPASSVGGTTPPVYTSSTSDRITESDYDAAGRAKVIRRRVNGSLLTVSQKTFNAFGEATQTWDTQNNLTQLEYNKLGKITKVTEPSRLLASTGTDVFVNQVYGSPVTTIDYDSFGQSTVQTRSTTAGAGVGFSIKHVYDFAGNEIETDDGLNNATYMEYDVAGHVIKQKQTVNVTNATSDINYTHTIEKRFEYDATGRQTATLDVFGSQKSGSVQVYNGYGEVTEERKVWGLSTDATATLMATANNNVLVTSVIYDTAGRVEYKRSTDGYTYFYYDLLGNVTRVEQRGDSSAAARVTESVYDLAGRVIKQRLPQYQSTATDALGSSSVTMKTPVMTQSLDRWGNALSRSDATGLLSFYTYNQDNQVVTEKGVSGQAINYAGNTYSSDLVHELGYDSLGRVLTDSYKAYYGATLLGTHTTTNQYNAAGQVIQTEDASGVKQQFAYDANGNRVGTKDAIGHVSVDTFDANNQLIKRSLIRSGITQASAVEYKTGSQSNPIAITLAYYQYDQAGRKYADSDGFNYQYYQYDERGNLLVNRNRTGGKRAYSYDELGNKTSETEVTTVYYNTYPNGPYGAVVQQSISTLKLLNSWQYKYGTDFVDYSSQLAQSHTVVGSTYNYSYTGFGQLRSETLGSNTVTYDYWENGQQKSIVESTSVAVAATGSNTAYTSTSSNASYFFYDIKGNKTAETNSTSTSNTAFTIINPYYGGNISVAAGSSSTGSISTFYRYDSRNRLVSVSSPKTSISLNSAGSFYTTDLSTLSYDYDEWNNRRRISATYTVQDGVQAARTPEWYSYDAANRVIVEAGISNGTSAGTIGNTKSVTYNYNSAGQRISEEHWVSSNIVPYGTTVLNENFNSRLYSYNDLGLVSMIQTRNDQRAAGQDSSAGYLQNGVAQVAETNKYDERGFKYQSNASGRTTYTDYNADGSVAKQRTVLDSTGRVETLLSNYTYDTSGNLTSYQYSNYDPNSSATDPKFYNTYAYTYLDTYAGRQVSGITVTSSQAGTAKGATTNTYDSRGRLTAATVMEASIVDSNKTGKSLRSFAYNASGQIIAKAEQKYGATAYKTQNYYYFNGAELANLGALDGVDISPLSAVYSGGNTPGTYVISGGDSLMGIAQSVFGDANLWYIIADANGLHQGPTDAFGTGDIGRSLRIPNSDKAVGNTSNNWKPYNPSEIIGDETPTITILPPPSKRNHCKALVKIVSTVIAAVVAAVTYIYAGPEAARVAYAMTKNYSQQYLQIMANGDFDWKAFGKSLIDPRRRKSLDPLASGLKDGQKIDYLSILNDGALAYLDSSMGGASGITKGITNYSANYLLNKVEGRKPSWSNRAALAAGANGYANEKLDKNGLLGDSTQLGFKSFNWADVAVDTLNNYGRAGVSYGINRAFEVKDTHWNNRDAITDAFGNALSTNIQKALRPEPQKTDPFHPQVSPVPNGIDLTPENPNQSRMGDGDTTGRVGVSTPAPLPKTETVEKRAKRAVVNGDAGDTTGQIPPPPVWDPNEPVEEVLVVADRKTGKSLIDDDGNYIGADRSIWANESKAKPYVAPKMLSFEKTLTDFMLIGPSTALGGLAGGAIKLGGYAGVFLGGTTAGAVGDGSLQLAQMGLYQATNGSLGQSDFNFTEFGLSTALGGAFGVGGKFVSDKWSVVTAGRGAASESATNGETYSGNVMDENFMGPRLPTVSNVTVEGAEHNGRFGIDIRGEVNGVDTPLGNMRGEVKNSGLLVDSYQTSLSRNNLSDKLFEGLIDLFPQNSKVIMGQPGGTNRTVLLTNKQPIQETPWAKSLQKFGYETRYDPVDNMMISVRKKQ